MKVTTSPTFALMFGGLNATTPPGPPTVTWKFAPRTRGIATSESAIVTREMREIISKEMSWCVENGVDDKDCNVGLLKVSGVKKLAERKRRENRNGEEAGKVQRLKEISRSTRILLY
jgi:hypothetical protein